MRSESRMSIGQRSGQRRDPTHTELCRAPAQARPAAEGQGFDDPLRTAKGVVSSRKITLTLFIVRKATLILVIFQHFGSTDETTRRTGVACSRCSADLRR